MNCTQFCGDQRHVRRWGQNSPPPIFLFFVPFQAHVKLTLNVGRTGCMYTDGVGRRLGVVEVMMMVVTAVHLETTAVVCASFV